MIIKTLQTLITDNLSSSKSNLKLYKKVLYGMDTGTEVGKSPYAPTFDPINSNKLDSQVALQI